jgi:hypothetical protein
MFTEPSFQVSFLHAVEDLASMKKRVGEHFRYAGGELSKEMLLAELQR